MMRWVAALACVSAAWAGEIPAAQMKAAAERALARFQASQKDWYSQQSCASCHHQFLPALVYRDARQHGIKFDEKIAREDAAQGFASFSDLDRAIEHANIVDPGVGQGYMLLAADAAGVRPSVVTEVYARLLAQRQEPDGHWATFDERPPQSYSIYTATALAAQVIGIYSHPSLKDDARRRQEKAREWLASHTPPDTEGRTFQLLGLLWTGADAAILRRRGNELAALQLSDGGWGELDGRASDAYSTGQALVALHDAGGIAVSDPVWQRGAQFLLRTQARDATWHVHTRLFPPAPLSPDYFESGYPYEHDQYLSAMGAEWAVMAFARALGPARKVEIPALLEAAPSRAPAWAETVLFGSAEDVKKLLDGGLDPNAATKDGTSALMMAAPDAAKMTLLLDRGAKVNARTQHGYSALMMSALYKDSVTALKLLLSRGATLRSDTPALYRAYPVALAAIAGSGEAVKLLRSAGDAVDDDYVYAGLVPESPLTAIASIGEADVAEALIESGATVDKPDPDGLTPLMWAALANKLEMARVLIAHGADVNHVDKHGMTALLYAASIDYGDSAMVRLLLKSGAKDGVMAAQLARKYGHTHLIEALK